MNPEIWAIAGGKGGTGKSFISSGLGFMLARRGKRVVLLDADWGGANLHSFLQIKKPLHTLTSFFDESMALNQLIVETRVPNLHLIPGDIRSLNPDNIKYTQRLKLYRHLKALDYEHVVMDLGAGSQLNIIDSFLVAHRMIVVIVPEITAIENLYHFLKRTIFRKISQVLRHYELKDIAKTAWRDRKSHQITNLKEFIAYLKGVSEEVSTIIERELPSLRIHFILNQVRSKEHIEMGLSIKSVIVKYFGIEAIFAGYVDYDEHFWRNINEQAAFADVDSESDILSRVGDITQNIIQGTHIKRVDF
jgi:flagellar biosynthesis protein FlhG